jgi:hypothetical protein
MKSEAPLHRSRLAADRISSSPSWLLLLFSLLTAADLQPATAGTQRVRVLTLVPMPNPQVQQVALGGLLQKLVAVFIAGIPLVVVGGLMYAFIAQEDVMAGFLVTACYVKGLKGPKILLIHVCTTDMCLCAEDDVIVSSMCVNCMS